MLAATLALAMALAGDVPSPTLPGSAPPHVRSHAVLRPAGPGRAGPAIAAARRAPSWAPDERMHFTIRYLGIPMGKARLSVGRPEGDLLPVFLEARTTGVGAIVDIREQLASYLTSTTGLPRMFSIDAFETGDRHSGFTHFEREAGKAYVREQGRHEQTYEIAIPPGTVDFVAMVFRLRTLPLGPGARHAFDVLTGHDLARVVAEVEGREILETPAGRFQALKVRVPLGFTDRFGEKSPTYVWFSDDARRIVLRISTDFAIGQAVASLERYEPGKRPGARSK